MDHGVLNIERWLQEQTRFPRATRAALQCFLLRNLPEWTEQPPVDPSVFAKKLGCDVLVEDVPSARLEVTRYSRVIRVPKKAPPYLQRFSMAHELAHLLFLKVDEAGVRRAYSDEALSSPDGRVRMNARSRLERFCDAAAGMMLVPNLAIEEAIPKGQNVSLDRLLALARCFDVTPPVLFHRLVDREKLPHYPGHVLSRYCENRFTGQDTKWRVMARALPQSEFFADFPWPNQSLEAFRVHIPPPGEIAAEPLSLPEHRGQRWKCEIESAKGDAFWALAKFTLESGIAQPGLRPLPPGRDPYQNSGRPPSAST